jgi:hypothetical protein
VTIPEPRIMGFEEWYANKFDWFVRKPMPLKIIYQAPIWILYGFVWIPLWYIISDKTYRGPIGARNQMGSSSIPLPPITQRVTAPPPLSVPQRGGIGHKAVDVNSASETELSNIPGIGIVLAKKAIEYRSRNGDFPTLDKFYEVLGLQPHIIANLSEKVTLSEANWTAPAGRTVDF